MDDFPRAEPPRFWIAFGILCITFALCFVMLVFNSVQAHAQQPPPCARMETIVKGMLEQFHESLIWIGIKTTAQGPTETFLFQSQDGKTWTQVDVVGKDENGKPIGCFVGVGTNGNPNDMGKGV
jgi:hypothetical protein